MIYTHAATALIAASIAATGAWQILKRVKRMHVPFRSNVGRTSKLNRPKCAEADVIFVNANLRSPAILPVFANPDSPSCTISSSDLSVLAVLNFGSSPEVVYPIVGPISVYMVDQRGRPLAKRVQPSEPVGVVVDLFDHYDRVTVRGFMPDSGVQASATHSPASGKVSAISVVDKHCAELIRRKGRIKSAHAARPYNDGLGSNACGLKHRGHCAF